MATYAGSCQCGATCFEADTDLTRTFTCNCSRCRRLGAVWTFIPADAFRLTLDGPMTEYRFHTHRIGHRFCSVCGIQTHGVGERDGQPVVAVNVNCLDGADARALDSRAVDGAST